MFKFVALCLLAIIAAVAAKPDIVTPLAYSTQYVASPYTDAYTTGYASPYVAADPYAASPYSAYSAYPYAAASYYVR